MSEPVGNRDRIGAWADFVYTRRGGVAHVLPHLASVFHSRMSSPVLCGRTTGLFEDWRGTGNQAEIDKARQMPLCIRCEALSQGRTR